MKRNLVGLAAGLMLGSVAMVASAGTVTNSGGQWGYNSVTVTNVSPGNPTFGPREVSAGGFAAAASLFGGADAWVNGNFTTYCVEFTEGFTPPTTLEYGLEQGGAYQHWGTAVGSNRAAISGRLGKLMTYVNSLTGTALVDSAAESAAVQLAVWETIYETPTGVDLSLNDGNFTESGAGNSSLRTAANLYLTNSASVSSIYDVYVLSRVGSQDWIALKAGGSGPQGVPEPGSIALSVAALGALAFARRRRTVSAQA
jgi:hypothetical protein